MLHLTAAVADEAGDRDGIAVGLALFDDDAALVDDADARTVERDVDPDKKLHGTDLPTVEMVIFGLVAQAWKFSPDQRISTSSATGISWRRNCALPTLTPAPEQSKR
jgi:hypothetical protein